MVELFIFSIGIVLGCAISFLFYRSGHNSSIESFKVSGNVNPEQSIKDSKTDQNSPELDTSMDWDGYPYTNDYNDAEQPIVIGQIDPDVDEKN
mgnify:CR=1 FL=1